MKKNDSVPKIAWSARSHTGLYRKENEDTIGVGAINFPDNKKARKNKIHISDSQGIISNEPMGVFLVADGMGGGVEGKQASWVASREFMHLSQELLSEKFVKNEKVLEATSEDVLGELKKIMDACHQVVEDENKSFQTDKEKIKAYIEKVQKFPTQQVKMPVMGTTLTSAVIYKKNLFFAHIGDSRIYLYRANQLKQLTKDHSMVGELLRRGLINEREARTHPRKNILNQILGANAQKVLPQVEHEKLQNGDILVICSDGLTDGLWDKNINSTVNFYFKDAHDKPPNFPKDSLEKIIELTDLLIATSLRASGKDNISVIVIQII